MTGRARSTLAALWTRVRDRSLVAFEPDAASGRRARLLMKAFYTYVAAVALQQMVSYRLVARQDPVAPLWPVGWAAPHWEITQTVLGAALGLAGVVAVVATRSRPVRITVFALLFLHAASLSSFGKVNHGFHHLVLVAFLLALAPTYDAEPDPARERHLHGSILLAQAALLLTYSLSGFWKIRTGVQQFLAGEPSLFGGESLARIVAARAIQAGQEAPLADFVVSNPLLSSALYLATVAVEVTAVAAVAWPRVAALWAVALMSFHLTVFWSMHINFVHSIALLAVLFLLSPFWRPADALRMPRWLRPTGR